MVENSNLVVIFFLFPSSETRLFSTLDVNGQLGVTNASLCVAVECGEYRRAVEVVPENSTMRGYDNSSRISMQSLNILGSKLRMHAVSE